MPHDARSFIWYDVMTTDMKAASDFYGAVVGWRIADSGMPGPPYNLLWKGDAMLGGMMEKPEGAPFPCMWTGYIHSTAVDADSEKAVKLGGSICKPPADIPEVGRFSVIADPHGAMFNLFQPNSSEGPDRLAADAEGNIGWRELQAGDAPSDWTFYEKMFGWKKEKGYDMGAMGVYQTFSANGEMIGGMMTKPPEMPQAFWNYFFNVAESDAAAARVKKAGGEVLMGPHQVPTGQWVLQCRDPQGAHFGLLAPKR